MPAGFRKSAVLFNLHRAAASGSDEVVAVEGFFDCMKGHQAGFTSVVALMGTTLSRSRRNYCGIASVVWYYCWMAMLPVSGEPRRSLPGSAASVMSNW